MKTIVFRVAAFESIGIGHLVRCFALAQQFRQQGLSCHFLLTEAAAAIASQLNNFNFPVTTITSQNALTGELDSIHGLANENDWLVIDGYEFSAAYRQQLSDLGFKLLWLDDWAEPEPAHVAAILNSGAGVTAKAYQHQPADTKLFLGPAYHPLRPEFFQQPYRPASECQALSIIFGGSDPANLMTSIAAVLAADTNFCQLPVQFICGPAYQRLDELEVLIAEQPSWQLLHNPSNIAEALNDSRLVVTACGSTTFECWALKRPMIAVQVAGNQQAQAQHLAEQELAEVYQAADFVKHCHRACQRYFDLAWLEQAQQRQSQQACGSKLAAIGDWLLQN
ncbi:MAG: UDP-2,4-diacetamido-2,4,6-trideoxy-beta-L-altropyranose hydrolase [Idiomarina sp.]